MLYTTFSRNPVRRLNHKALHAVALLGWLAVNVTASVSRGQICSDKCTCCHTEKQVAIRTCYLTQSQFTDTGPTSPSADPVSQASGEAEQTVHHILQDCPVWRQQRHQLWPQDESTTNQLWGTAEDLRRTTQFLATCGLRV